MRFFLSLLLIFSSASLFSQNAVKVNFDFMNNNQPIDIGNPVPALNGVMYSISDVAFYISEIKIIHDGGMQTANDTVVVVRDDASEFTVGYFNVTNIEAIHFMVGVPEELNHLDISQYPEDHPLSFQDPSMQWGWSAGYMHFIMSGFGDDDGDGSPTATYQLHCLGDENTKNVQLPVTAFVHPDGTREILINVNVDQWLEGTDPATTGSVHGSDGVNTEVMDNVNSNPVFTVSQSLSVTELNDQLQLSVHLDEASATISWSDKISASAYEILNAEGKILGKGNVSSNSLSVPNEFPGLHLIRLYNSGNQLLGSTKWVAL